MGFISLMIAAVINLTASNAMQAADFEKSEAPESMGGIQVSISGLLSTGDCHKLRSTIGAANLDGQIVVLISLNSLGGSLYEGLCMGREVRRIKAAVEVRSDPNGVTQICASACAFVWLGGLYRLDSVYVHHPFMKPNETQFLFDEFEQSLGNARFQIEGFVDEMNLSDTLSDRFLAVRSTDVEQISAATNGLAFDPIFAEFVIAQCGSELLKDEVTILRALEDSEKEGSLGDPVYRWAFNYLHNRELAWQECGRNQLRIAARQAQNIPEP